MLFQTGKGLLCGENIYSLKRIIEVKYLVIKCIIYNLSGMLKTPYLQQQSGFHGLFTGDEVGLH